MNTIILLSLCVVAIIARQEHLEHHDIACATDDTKCVAFQTCLLTAASANPFPSAGALSTEAARKAFMDAMKQKVVNCENSSGFNITQHHANNGTQHG